MSIPFYDLSLISFVDQPINFTGNFLTYELADINKFSVDSQGNVTLSGTIPAGHLSGLGTLPDSVLSSNVALLNANNQFTGQPQYFRGSLSTSANYGRLSLGSGAFDGATSGFFTGSSSGTQLAVNASSAFTGNFVDYQIAGVSKYKLDYQGNLTLSGTIPAGNMTGSHTLPDGVLSTNVPLLNVANVFGNSVLVTAATQGGTAPMLGVQLGNSVHITTIAASTTGGTLLDNTTYYYVVANVDQRGKQTIRSAEVSVTTGNSGGNTNKNTLTLTNLFYGASSIFVYRSTVSGNYTGVPQYRLINSNPLSLTSFVDTGAATSTGTANATTDTSVGAVILDPMSSGSLDGYYFCDPNTSIAKGLINIGPSFDGVAPGAYQPPFGVTGSDIAINSRGIHDFINCEVTNITSGAINTSKDMRFRVDASGITYTNPVNTSPYFRGILGAPTTVNTPTTATSGGTLLDNTTYYYKVTSLDVTGAESWGSSEVSVTTGNSGSNVNKNTITWGAPQGAPMGYRVYRTTVSGSYTSTSFYRVINAVTLTDTGATPTGTATIPGDTTMNAFSFRLGVSTNNAGNFNHFPEARVSNAVGFISIGNGPFDGTTQGAFLGSANGTLLAANLKNGSSSDLINLQIASSATTGAAINDQIAVAFRVTNSGSVQLKSGAQKYLGSYLGPPLVTNTPTTSTSGGTLLDNTQYFYKVSCLDPMGIESWVGTEVTVTTGNSGGNTNTNTVTWANSTSRAMGYWVYRTTVSGNYTSVQAYKVINALTFTDTGAAGTTKSPNSGYTSGLNTNDGQLSSAWRFGQSVSTAAAFICEGGNSANFGLLSLGSGPFDGTANGAFFGSSTWSTALAINLNNSSTADLIHAQIAGSPTTAAINDSSRTWFRVFNSGDVRMKSGNAVNFGTILQPPTTINTPTTSTSGGTLLDSTPYFYVVTALDVRGLETWKSSEVTVTTGNSGGNTNSNTVTWTAGQQGIMGYKIYRSTVSGNYTSKPSFTVINAVTFTDTGAAGTSATPPASTTTNAYGFRITVDSAAGSGAYFPKTVDGARAGYINVGSGPFDNASTGFFAGSNNGTHLAVNAVTGFVGSLIDLQIGGTSFFSINQTTGVKFANPTSGVQINANLLTVSVINTPTTSTSGGTLLDNTAYFYEVCALDVFNTETPASVQVTVTTGNSGGNTNSNTVTWTAIRGAMGYNIYRSTTTGNFTNSKRFTSVGTAVSFTDTGAAGTTATPTAAGVINAIMMRLDATNSAIAGYYFADVAGGARHGILNIGSGPFDNATTGKFAGSASSTHIAINAVSGYAGSLIDAQVAGVSNFIVGLGDAKIANAAGTRLKFSMYATGNPNNPTTATSGGTLLDNTTYYYVMTALDVQGNEQGQSAQVQVTTGNSGGNTNSNTITWTAMRGPMGYSIYRSTTSGNFTNSVRYTVIGTNVITFTDTGSAGTTATPAAAGSLGANNCRIDLIPGGQEGSYFSMGSTVTGHATVNIGSGPFDGATTGFFSGIAGGTLLGINATTGYTGGLVNYQVAGVSKYSITSAGNVAFAGVLVPGVLDAPVFASTLSLTVTAGEVHKVGSITGAMTINASAGGVAGQRMTIILPNDSSGTGWVITFGTNFKPSGTLTGTSAKSATASWISDGTSWYEVSRATGLTL